MKTLMPTQPLMIPFGMLDPAAYIEELNKQFKKVNKNIEPLEIKTKINLEEKELQHVRTQLQNLKKPLEGKLNLSYVIDPAPLHELDQSFQQLAKTYEPNIDLSLSTAQLTTFLSGFHQIVIALQQINSLLDQLQSQLATTTPVLQGFFRGVAQSAASDVAKDVIKQGATSFTKELTEISTKSGQMSASFGTATTATRVLQASATGLTVSLRALSASFLPLAIISGISFALEGLISLFSNKKRKQEELAESNRRLKAEQDQLASTWGKEQENIQQLTAEYEKLREIQERSTEEQQRYLAISSQLGTLMPSLVSHTDELGQAHLKSAQAIETELEYAKKLYELRNEAFLLETPDVLKELRKKNKATQKELDNLNFEIELGTFLNLNPKQLNELKTTALELEKDLALRKLEAQEILVANTKIQLEAKDITIDESLNSFLENFFQEVNIDLPKEKLDKIGSDVAQFVRQTQQSMLTDHVDWEHDVYLLVKQIEKAYPELGSSFQQLSNAIVDAARSANDVLYPVFDAHGNKIGEISGITSEATAKYGNLTAQYNEAKTAITGYTTAVEASTGKTWENITAAELLLGVNTEHYKQMHQAIEVIQLLSQMENLNAEQKAMLAGATEYLESLYPHLSGRIVENIGFLFEEAQMLDLVSGQSGLTAEALIKNQDETTINALDEIKARISAYKDEIEALKELTSAQWLMERVSGNDQQISVEDLEKYSERVRRIKELEAKIAQEEESRRNLLYSSGVIKRPNSKSPESSSSFSSNTIVAPSEIDPYEINQYANSMQYIDTQIKLIDGKMSRLSQTSNEHSKALNDQIYLMNVKQKKMSEERQSIDAQIAKLKEQLAVTKDVEKQNDIKKQIESLTSSSRSLQTSWWDIDVDKHSKIFERQMITFKQLSKTIEEYDHQLALSQAIQSKHQEGTVEWNNELIKQNKLFHDKRAVLLEQIDVLEKLLETGKLFPPQEEEVRQELNSTRLEYEKLNDTMRKQYDDLKRQREKIADDIIALYKNMYQKQKDLALKAIDEELKALEKAHREKMDILDKELKKYEDVINAKLRSLEDEANEDDYNKQLTKEQEKLQELEDRIAILALDNSIEAAARRAELEKQLAEQKETIESMQLNRSRELQKRHLQEQMDNYRKDVESKKTAEQQKYDQEKERLEQVRKETEYHYNELINNEREFARIREEIMAGNIENLQGQLDGFLNYFTNINKDAAREIGQSYEELLNIIDRVNHASGQLDGIATSPIQNVSGNKESAWNTYLNNKKKAEDEFKRTGKWNEALRQQNDQLRNQYGFSDGSYDQLKNKSSFDTGGYTGNFKGGKLAFLHEKEIVLDKHDTYNFLKAINLTRSIFSNFRPPVIEPSWKANSTDGTVIQRIEINIKEVTGGKKGADSLISHTLNALKGKGVILNI